MSELVKCHHCKEKCTPIELSDETYQNVDMHGPVCLVEVDQAIYEGMNICAECYTKEGGIC